MPPVIFLAAAVIGGTALARFAYREAKRINAELDRVRLSRVAEKNGARENRKLRLDPESGTYRPL